MNPKTIAKQHDIGRIARIQCVKNDTLRDLDIKDKCFLMLIMYEGTAKFKLDDRIIVAQAPCIVCFDETKNPRLVSKRRLRANSIYFNPIFFNVNLTFDRIKNKDFRQAALAHDLFLMLPFTDENKFVFPIFGEYIDSTERIFGDLADELQAQTDVYWSCRCRTYFIQLIFLLERIYGMIGNKLKESAVDVVRNEYLRKAVMFIEGHYSEDIKVDDIAKYASINHTTLTLLFKNELEMTPIEYLWHHRINVAKKQLQFTFLPIKEIAMQCGFKTLQHFCRKFEELTSVSPKVFRNQAVEKRMAELNHFEIEKETTFAERIDDMSEKVLFDDREFESYIREWLSKDTGDITKQDMMRIDYLDLGFRIFRDISPIKYCKNLRKIRFDEGFMNNYDLSIFGELSNLNSVSLFNPKEHELAELYRYVDFTSLDIIWWGNADICNFNAYTKIEQLNIMNFTGKAFSCKNISALSELRKLRLVSAVTDDDILKGLLKLEEYCSE